jgi:hypothetical protein
MATRSIVYDDQDTDIIQYSGQWYPHTSAEDNAGNFGPPYLRTLHGTNHDASVSFEFDGTHRLQLYLDFWFMVYDRDGSGSIRQHICEQPTD